MPVAGIICVLQIALLGFIQVAHVHEVGADASHCPLCVLLHSAAPMTATAAVVVLVRMEFAARVFKERALVRYWHPKLFTRPPPVGC
ncbi:MAG TPA: DUF2946 family protein [Terracidiphilus sp.]|nr:DUF2946 family protein [Terracidiphilus sp.]